ncbi:radical SAM/SPASM domain-containing protein [Anaerobium acetethylicum]|uniref:Radical SAM additional 4Fe4S-binding SPASM domain-containing protein n=1 Tax=Anaerobium acetethylicum TaxID=1619234 RepID=A0A1D3TRJ7_9FIRM|nr:radical SAM/SPASM domain-containing protein [Anaerobium acetethylicum]SCP96348.1 radical SAM additional 4Fe4S-binding SPASM domain-containing protein [Anaerobium acetethylicum]
MKKFKRIYVEITNICNLACTFCPRTKRKPRTMSAAEFLHVLEETGPYTDYIYLHIKGEPLLHPELEEILKLCGEKGVSANITTNGTLIPQAFDALKNAKSLRQINISLHSFDANTGIDFEGYLKSVTDAAKYFSANTKTITALRLWNLDRDNTTLENRARNLHILEYLEHSFGLDSPIVAADIKDKGVKLAERVYLNSDYEFEWPSLENSHYSTEGFCYGMKTQIGILADGTVVPCCLDGEGVINLGNIFTESFSDILRSERAAAIAEGFRNRTAAEELCRHCSFKDRF